jgi:hypothetical protein
MVAPSDLLKTVPEYEIVRGLENIIIRDVEVPLVASAAE